MSRVWIQEICGAICPWLALVLVLVELAKRWSGGRLRGPALLAAGGVIGAGLLAWPVDGLPLARWIAALNANFSVTLTGLLAVLVWENAFGRKLFSPSDWAAAWGFGAMGGLVLYPLAMGWGEFDPYEWGWGFSPLFVAAGALTAWWLWRRNRFGWSMLAAVVAWHFRLMESENYWDYLLDPIYSLTGLTMIIGLNCRGCFRKHHDAQTSPRSDHSS